jgi:hypothetical protein
MKHNAQLALWLLVVALTRGAACMGSPSRPMGELVIAWHVTSPPAYLDPAEAPPQVGPFALSDGREKKRRGRLLTSAGAAGNAVTRVDTCRSSRGDDAYGGSLEIDARVQPQAVARDPVTRAGVVHRLQPRTVERVRFAPVMENRVLQGVGPRIAEHTLHAIPSHALFSCEALWRKGP